MKILQFNPRQCGVGRVGSKKSNAIPTPPCGVGLKSHLILTPPPLWDWENSCGVKRGGLSQVGRGGAKLPSLVEPRF